VIIGDFGFAKSGADLTNSLVGTPLFSAPEIATTMDAGPYTAKIDIFSIGMTFYRMVVGKYPWVPRTREELRRLMNEQTGKNLPFPTDVPLPEATKDFLRKTTEPNPELRPNLDQLFNHAIFVEDMSMNLIAGLRSVMFFGNKVITDKLFDENKAKALGNIEFLNLDEVDHNDVPQLLSYPTAPYSILSISKASVVNLKPALDALYHEKQVAYFVFISGQELTELERLIPESGQLASQLIKVIALLLTKKALLLNTAIVRYLTEGSRTQNIPNFNAFVGSPECETILAELFEDNGLLNDCLENLKNQITANPELAHSPEYSDYFLIVDNQELPLDHLNEIITEKADLLNAFKTDIYEWMNHGERCMMARGLAKIKISLEEQDYLPSSTPSGGSFDWYALEDILHQETESPDTMLTIVKQMVSGSAFV
jgi:hypothetical protein